MQNVLCRHGKGTSRLLYYSANIMSAISLSLCNLNIWGELAPSKYHFGLTSQLRCLFSPPSQPHLTCVLGNHRRLNHSGKQWGDQELWSCLPLARCRTPGHLEKGIWVSARTSYLLCPYEPFWARSSQGWGQTLLFISSIPALPVVDSSPMPRDRTAGLDATWYHPDGQLSQLSSQ